MFGIFSFQELPASLGNLRHLRFLDVNVNNLHAVPSTIGGCQALSILTLRHNQLSELPMELGKLNVSECTNIIFILVE
jgi:Leucine-rich repeat (LRR) protein